MRRRFVLAVIVLHGLLLWLLAVGFRQRDSRPEVAQLQIVSLWITPPAPVRPVEPPSASSTSANASSARQVLIAPAPAPAPAVPVTPPLEARPEPDSSPATATPPVDWTNAARLSARRIGQALGGPPPKETFSEPPEALAKPCVPKESSLKWKGTEPRTNGICALTLGYSCRDRANWHLLDDMKDPERSTSSVPDPNVCD
jgi:hypothetical protein